MLRPLLSLGAAAIFGLCSISTVDAQPGRGGGGPGGFGGGRGFGGPGIGMGGPGMGGIGFGGPGMGGIGIGGSFGPGGYGGGYYGGGYYGGGNWGGSPYMYGNVPMSSRYGYYNSPTYVYPSTTTVIPAQAQDTAQYGLQITQVFDGGAKKAALHPGDVILSVGKTRTESFEALQVALVGAKEVEIVFLNHESKKVEKLPVKVDDNKIGVEVIPVAMH